MLPLPNKQDLQTAHPDYPPAYSPIYDDDFSDKHSIREYFNIVYKRLPIILSLTILTTAVVAFYMYRQPSMYMAQMDMIIEPPKPKLQDKNSVVINNYGDDLKYTNTQLLLLQNFDLMRDVVVDLGLYREPNLFNDQDKGVLSTFRSMFSGGKDDSNKTSLPVLTDVSNEGGNTGQIALTPEEKVRAERYAGILAGGLKVEPEERTNIVHVSLQSTKPELAAKAADKLAEVFIAQDIERETQGAKKAYDDLSKSIDELKLTIDTQTQAMINEQAQSGLALTGDKGQELSAGTLQNLSAQLLAAKDERRKIEASYNAAIEANSKGQILAVLGDNPAILNVREKLAARKEKANDRIQELNIIIQNLKAKKSQLLARYTEEYKDVIAVTEEIKKREDDLEATKKESSQNLDQEETKVKSDVAKEVLTGMRAQLAAAQNREGQLQNAFNAEIASSNQKGVAETRLTTLTRGIETQRQLLDTYTQSQKSQELAIAGSRPDNIKISSRAQTPESPIGPKRNRNIFIAFLMSLAAGIGLAFLLDYLDDSVKSSDDIGRHLGLPTLASIPHHSTLDKRKFGRLSGKTGQGVAGSLALVAIEDNRSAMAEAYRHLRTSLLFSSAGKPPQTILVTSSQPAEGKTTTAINSAITLAQSGAEVVIIDCDLRRPRLHSHFGLDNVSGLTNYLSGERNPANLLKTFPELPNLKIITSGPLPPNPAELLSSNEMKNLLQYLKGNYKHIIIDSPPAISFTDAAILATVVDGVILVALAGKSSIHLMRRFKQRLGTLGARIYGVVLNGIKSDSVEYGYYGYGQSYNYYAADDDDSTPLMEEEKAFAAHDTKN
ncbi:MAG: polysaccharide biosynthesis tyrosine autokinase [Acidobacteriota bacterium]